MGGCKRVNKDLLRDMLDCGEYSGENEMFILEVRDRIIFKSLSAGYDVIVDDCNFNPIHLEKINEIAFAMSKTLGEKVEVTIISMGTSVEECIKRDSERKKSVGENVIRAMEQKYGGTNRESLAGSL